MTEIKSANVPQLTVDGVVNTLSAAYAGLVRRGVGFKAFPSVMLWGAPGVGKSQAVKQIAKKLQAETGKKCVVTDVRLLLFNPVDLRGIPTANEDKTLAVWLKPKIFQMDERSSVINILFLDEISSAPQSVQAAAYQITLDRVVGEHKLPENCIVIAAGNRVTDRSVAYKMPKALANRLMHFEVESNFDSWRRWAVENGVNAKVVGFIAFKRNYLLNSDASADDLAYATPRSWEAVSNVLNLVDDDAEKVFPMICGLVGRGVAIEFRTWSKIYSTLPGVEDVFAGREAVVPQSTDALYALVSAMVQFAREHKDNLKMIENSIAYSLRMPPDFSVVLIKDYFAIEEGYRQKLLAMPTFRKWLERNGRILNGNI